MKTPIHSNPPSFFGLDCPTFHAEQFVDGEGRTLWRIWCDHCLEHHYHGPMKGHRIAHCADPASLYWQTGYNVERGSD